VVVGGCHRWRTLTGQLLIDVEHWLLNTEAGQNPQVLPLVHPGGVERGRRRHPGWTRCWVLRKRTLQPHNLSTRPARVRMRVDGAGVFLLDRGTFSRSRSHAGGVGGPGCFLRTAQWTRASLEQETAQETKETPWPCLPFSVGGVMRVSVSDFRVVCCSSVAICLIVLCVQVFKGIRWMPWHQEPMKDVGACDMPRGVGNQTVIRGFPNGGTWHPSWGVAAG
jgi:hypothetical protein